MDNKHAVDEQIIQLLEKDARQSSSSLAKQLNMSPATVRRRVRKLIQNGVLRIMAVVDPEKVGTPLAVVMAFDVDPENLRTIAQKLVDDPRINWASLTTGRFDVVALGRFRSYDELTSFLEGDLPRSEGIKDSETFICLRGIKGIHVKR